MVDQAHIEKFSRERKDFVCMRPVLVHFGNLDSDEKETPRAICRKRKDSEAIHTSRPARPSQNANKLRFSGRTTPLFDCTYLACPGTESGQFTHNACNQHRSNHPACLKFTENLGVGGRFASAMSAPYQAVVTLHDKQKEESDRGSEVTFV